MQNILDYTHHAITIARENLRAYFLQTSRPSLLWVVILHHFLWSAICFLPDDPIATRRTTVYMHYWLSSHGWAFLFAIIGAFQFWASTSSCKYGTCQIVGNAISAALSIYVLAAVGVSVWPTLPALLPGQIVVTLAACLLFVTTDHRQ
jgi:hypothetical protein